MEKDQSTLTMALDCKWKSNPPWPILMDMGKSEEREFRFSFLIYKKMVFIGRQKQTC
jgi:hypothetical protein